jgi:hypothetical protein
VAPSRHAAAEDMTGPCSPIGRSLGSRRRSLAFAIGSLAGIVLLSLVVSSRPAGTGNRVERAIGGGDDGPNLPTAKAVVRAGAGCDRWVSPTGSDTDDGSTSAPWATLEHAVKAVPDRGCTVWFTSGVYPGDQEIERKFTDRTVFRAVDPYRAVLQNDGTILDIGDRASRMTFRGFRIRQTPGAAGVAVYVSGGNAPNPAPNHLTFADNIFHDAIDEDLLKIRSRARSITVRGNVFYNQGSNEQHIDANSVTDVVIEGNVFFNDFAASGRTDDGTTKHFIVVKDSNEGEDGLRGSEGITIRRNVFLSWQGDEESFVGIGNDGKSYHEAKQVRIERNLLVGDGRDAMNSPLTVYGAKGIVFVNNTIVGDLPSDAFAFEVNIKGRNPKNRGIRFWNNIWADPTGTMSQFSDGVRANTNELTLSNNLYWNGGRRIPAGDLVSPLRHDARRIVGDPRLATSHGSAILPVWDGSSFASGETSIRAEFVRLVRVYGSLPAGSPAVGRASPPVAPPRDILGRTWVGRPDLGAFEAPVTT